MKKLLLVLGFTVKINSKQVRKLFYDYYFTIKEFTTVSKNIVNYEISF